jgi:hypothetical protein
MRDCIERIINIEGKHTKERQSELKERIEELESENKSLREALEAISLMESPAPHVKDIARQALEER